MGYDLHITRAAEWPESEMAPIALEEWLAHVERDEGLELDPDKPPGLAVWKADPTGTGAWIDWADGRLFSKNPDEPLIRKMYEIAAKLDARLVGDNGEEYGPSGHPVEPEGAAETTSAPAPGRVVRPWWKRLFRG